MKNFSLRRATALLLLLTAAEQVSATALELRIPYTPHSLPQTTIQTITGTVTDSRGPLPGVTITVKGKNYIAITDQNGAFKIEANTGDTLVFSSIGYKTQEVTFGGITQLKIVLGEDATSLQEVTVNAGYYTVKEKERTGSIARITAKNIETQPVTNAIATLAGRMAGVTVTQATGVAGGSFDIRIRGINSLRSDGNAPLYIIDGVPYSSESIGLGITNTVQPGATSPLNNINPADIESLEVLKDADATAIYGSRGANGVVLITTKKGKAGKTMFYGSYSRGVGRVTRFMDMMNTQQYIAMREEAFANDGFTEIPSFAYDINGTWDRNRYTDWQKELLGGTAEFTQIQASVSGGSERTQFLLSGNFNKETTVFPGDFAYKKGNFHSSFSHRSNNDRFNLTFSASYTVQDNDQPSADITTAAWLLPPNAPALYDEDGNLNWENGTFTNPLAPLQGKTKIRTYDFVANAVLSYNILPSLQAKANIGYTDLKHTESSSFPSTIYDPAYGVGSEYSYIFLGNSARQSWIVEPQLRYTHEFGKLKAEVLVGSTFQQMNNEVQALYATGFPSNNLLYNPAAATNLTVQGNDIF